MLRPSLASMSALLALFVAGGCSSDSEDLAATASDVASGSGATSSSGATGNGATGNGATGSGATGSGATGSGATGSGAAGSGAGSDGGATSGGGAGGGAGTGGLPWTGPGFVVDHSSVALFDRIPEQYLEAARNLKMLFSDRSVGQNIHEALDCLTATSWVTAPASCRRDYYDASWNWKTYGQADLDAGTVPARILFSPDPTSYSRDNWNFEFKTGDWSELTQDFVQVLAPAYVATHDVLSYQLSYLNVAQGSDIADPSTGYFSDNPSKYDVHDFEAYIAQHPSKTFILWTTSLARGIGSAESTAFNDAMRSYASQNGKVLFDVADIESHTDQGIPCWDNRDGVQYCNAASNCENHPDDGQQLPAICQDYTTEIDGGHLGSVSAAKILIAKAFWVVMARVAGWNP